MMSDRNLPLDVIMTLLTMANRLEKNPLEMVISILPVIYLQEGEKVSLVKPWKSWHSRQGKPSHSCIAFN